MATGSVGTTSPLPYNTAAKEVSDAFDPTKQKDMFLKLLVAQLKNQDPSSPMDQKDMMAQMAQFSTVEQLANMAKSLDNMSANATFTQSIALIGKSVDYIGQDGAVVQGASVTAVSAAGGQTRLVLGDGSQITPSDVVMVH